MEWDHVNMEFRPYDNIESEITLTSHFIVFTIEITKS